MSGRITSKRVVGFIRNLADGDGLIKPERVVEAARPKASPIHDQFEWNNTAAAEKYRLLQASELIRVSVEIIDCGGGRDPIMVRAFTSLATERGEGGGYRATVQVLSNKQMREQMLADAIAELQAFEKRYEILRELAEVFAASRKLRKTA